MYPRKQFVVGHVIVLLVLVFAGSAKAADGQADESAMFPFVISYDAQDNATNVSNWLHRPAGRHGFVRAENGHLLTDEGPIRFWATNLCFDACFPSREQAQRMAARMARLGINCVRMHHMDSHSIWGDSPDRLTIDPKQLAKLDYLIYQLKQQGIYTNLNLHVSRWFREQEGFTSWEGRPNYDKGLDNFEPRMIALQKKYARDLLTHVNPYTKTAYTDEPAIAMVEINNENALFAVWSWNQLDDLSEPYKTTFRKLWNQWLRDKYGDTARLAKAWNSESVPLGDEMLKNGDFSTGQKQPWVLERDPQCQVDWSIQPGSVDGVPGQKPLMRIVVVKGGTVPWRPQLVYTGFQLVGGKPYTLSFKMRTDKKRRVGIRCMMGHEPWQGLGFSNNLEVGPQWKDYRFTFMADKDDAKARLSISDLKPGVYELSDVSLRPGGTAGLRPGQSLKDDSVPLLQHGNMNNTSAARRDFVDFLWQTDHDYWLGMYRFLKDDLELQSIVSGTQRGYGPLFPQTKLDYIDNHAYWQHPHFPGRPWDMSNWTLRNTPMVNKPPGTLGSLAAGRVWKMPYTVSEYNHPAPNVYQAEGLPMIAAVGRFQDWDGMFSFAYAHSEKVAPQKIDGFFDIRSNTASLAHMQACSAMFMRGDVKTARETFLARISPKMERQMLYQKLNSWSLNTSNFGLDQLTPLVYGVALELVDDATAPGVDEVQADGKIIKNAKRSTFPKTQKVFVSDTAELRWDVSQDKAGYFTVDTPRSKLFTGFARGRTFDLGNVRLTLGKTRLDWATVSMVCLDGKGFDRPGRVLIAATGLVYNRGAKLRELGEDRVTLGRNWGQEPVMCEGVPAEIILPLDARRVRVFALDGSGNRSAEIKVSNDNARAKVVLGPQYKTVWYELEIR